MIKLALASLLFLGVVACRQSGDTIYLGVKCVYDKTKC